MGEAVKLISLNTGNNISQFFLFKRSNFSRIHVSKIKRQNTFQTKDDWTLLFPDEILLKIFKHLPKICLLNISSVCQRWNRISSDRILWKGIDISRKSVSFSDLASILSKGVVALKMVKAEVTRKRTQSENTSLEPSEGYQLSMLDASMASISTEDLIAILSQCKKLEKLSLERCTLNIYSCRGLGASSHLKVLNISYCIVVTAEFISQLSRLEELNATYISINYKNTLHLLSHLPTTLKRLKIVVFQSLSDEDISTICLSCPNLIELDISRNKRLTDRTIDIIMKLLPNLQHLSVGGCFAINLLKLAELKSMKSLKTLTIHHMLDETTVGNLSKLLVGVQINRHYSSTVARSLSEGKDKLWGFPIDKF